MIGKTISHYKIVDKLGEGGMGEVYLADDTSLDRKVALKFLPERLQQDPTARKRFLREAKSAAALDHPYICKIYQVGEENEVSFIAMEYVQGQTLREKLTEGPLPLKEGIRTAVEIVEALEKAHQEGIVHRDLKPSNIMLTPEGHVKVMDFGLAKRIADSEAVVSEASQPMVVEELTISSVEQEETFTGSLTLEGTTVGTLAYMSPEQIRGEPLDARSDLFSFGIMLHEMLSGVHPFRKEVQLATVTAILSDDPPSITDYLPNAPQLLQHILDQTLNKYPEQRYFPTSELLVDVTHLFEGVYIRRRTGVWIPVIALAGLIIIAGLLMRIGRHDVQLPYSIKPFISTPNANENWIAWSPGGDQIAYARAEQGIWICNVEGSDHRHLTKDYQGIFHNLTWSHDGQRIVFHAYFDGCGIYSIPVIGGDLQLIIKTSAAAGSFNLHWNEETNCITYTDIVEGEHAVFTVSLLDGIRNRLIPSLSGGHRDGALSKSGTLLAFIDVDQNLCLLNLRSSSIDTIANYARSPYWHPGGKFLYYISAGDDGNWDLYSVKIDSKTGRLKNVPGPLTNGIDIGNFAFHPGGEKAIISRIESHSHLYSFSVDLQSGDIINNVTQLTGGKSDSEPWWTANEEIVFQSLREGSYDILKLVPGNPAPVQIVSSELEEYSPVTPINGNWIAYNAPHEDAEEWLHFVQINGGSKHPLDVKYKSEFAKIIPLRWSPNGNHLLADIKDHQDKSATILMSFNPAEGMVTTYDQLEFFAGTTAPLWTPDSKRIVYVEDKSLWSISVEGGDPQRLCDLPESNSAYMQLISHTLNPRFLYFSEGSNIWRIPLNEAGYPSGFPQQLDWDLQQVGSVGTHIDMKGNQVVFDAFGSSPDLWLLEFLN